jgi:hypothetical protein
MSDSLCETALGIGRDMSAGVGMCVGQVVDVMRNGRALVDFPGNPGGPVEARQAVEGATVESLRVGKPISVVLAFENGDMRLPIIMGIVREGFPQGPQVDRMLAGANVEREILVDGKNLTLDAHEELTLKCGKSSITLRKDGKIVIKGMHLVSWAGGTNRIKGGSVAIN